MIGIYDSGVGGLAILQAIRERLPDADLTYLADQANVPYGERSLDEIRRLATDGVALLVGRGAGTVVVACNTASAAALSSLREAFPEVAIVGMEPAVKPAAAGTVSGVIGVLATPATFAAAGFEELLGRFASDVEVIAHPCPGWAAAVEDRWPDGARSSIKDHLVPLLDRDVDTIVLACTHYTFVAEVIREVVGETVAIIDPTDAVADQAVRVAGDLRGRGGTSFMTTGDPARLTAQIERLLGWQVPATGV